MAAPKRHPYQTEIDEAYDSIGRDQTECDKQLLTLSSGFLAVSLAFIKDVVSIAQAHHLWELYLSWALLGCCIMLVLFSFQFSIAGNFKAKHYWEKLPNNADLKYPYGHAIAIKWLNRVSATLFGLGVFCLVSFIIWNIHTEAGMPIAMDGSHMRVPQQGELIQKGSNMKAPAVQPVQPQAQTNPNTSSSTTGQGQGNTKK